MAIKRGEFYYRDFDEMPVILTVAETAAVLVISTDAVTKHCRNGNLPAKQIGRNWYINKNDLKRYLIDERKECI